MKLKGKIVLITASTRGIGLACVKACANEGATVYMAARNLELAKEEADKLNSQGCDVRYVYNDASKPESYKTMTEEVIKDAGRIDVCLQILRDAEDIDMVASRGECKAAAVIAEIAELFQIARMDELMLPKDRAVDIGCDEDVFKRFHDHTKPSVSFFLKVPRSP